MKDAESMTGIGILTSDEQRTPIDSSVRKAGTPPDGNAYSHSKDRLHDFLSVGAELSLEVPRREYDAIALRTELNWLEEIEHPWGPFPTYQRHLDYILSQYDAATPPRDVRPSRTEGRKD